MYVIKMNKCLLSLIKIFLNSAVAFLPQFYNKMSHDIIYLPLMRCGILFITSTTTANSSL